MARLISDAGRYLFDFNERIVQIAGIRVPSTVAFSKQTIEWANHLDVIAIQHVGINHRGLDIFMTQQLLDRANIGSRL